MWAKVLDGIANSGNTTKWIAQEDSSPDAEIEKENYVDLDIRKGERRKKKAKRFGSLLEIQNKSLTDSERRKRDRALKRRKWSKHLLEESELSGKSLSDSDINNRISKMVSEAKQVLKLGKKIGCNIVGDEDEFINDLVDLELNVRKEG
ncbi:hypothetical protein GQ457_04G009240 [Hibiscus cannabinus]